MEHLRKVLEFQQWERSFLREHPCIPQPRGWFTAVVLNYRRPQNIDLQARVLLNTPSVRDVVISNNDPSCDLEYWLRVPSGRVRVMNQPRNSSTAVRPRIARDERFAKYFLWMDDDIFLKPEQLESLCKALTADPSVPHGVYGQEWTGEKFRGGITGREGRIDVVSRAVVCTKEHVEEFFRLTEILGWHAGHPAWGESVWDDILLSFSGNARPRIHDFGPFVDCPTQGKRGVAGWRRNGFHGKREEFFRRMQEIKPLV